MPDTAVHFTKADLFFVPFSILWAAFTVFWEVGAASTKAPGFFLVWGGVFMGMGLYITVGRFFFKARRKRKTIYLLTDQRAAVLVGEGNLSEAPWRGLPRQVARHRDGRHVDVIFESTFPTRWGAYSSMTMASMRTPAWTGLHAEAPAWRSTIWQTVMPCSRRWASHRCKQTWQAPTGPI